MYTAKQGVSQEIAIGFMGNTFATRERETPTKIRCVHAIYRDPSDSQGIPAHWEFLS